LIIFASTVTGVFSLLVNLFIVLVVVLITEGVPPLLWLVPIPFICLVLFSTGVGLILAALYVKFRDLSQIWNVLALAIFWLTPVVYSVSLLPESTQIIMFINPLARIFMMFRHYLLYDLYDTQFLVLTVVSSLVMFAVGFLVFRRFQDTIAEQL
jgi:ABC-type polysaccharide/polyol phosphate export permease